MQWFIHFLPSPLATETHHSRLPTLHLHRPINQCCRSFPFPQTWVQRVHMELSRPQPTWWKQRITKIVKATMLSQTRKCKKRSKLISYVFIPKEQPKVWRKLFIHLDVIHPQCFGTFYGVWTFKYPKQQMRHQSSSHMRRGWHMILSVPWQVTKTPLVNMAYRFQWRDKFNVLIRSKRASQVTKERNNPLICDSSSTLYHLS